MTEILKAIVHNLGENIPQMITFISTPIDLQPWEQFAQAQFISSSTTELNLTSLLRDMLGHASVPAIFGHALMEKYPGILHDMYDMDAGRSYLLRKLPPWIPWPGIVQAHMARFKVWQCLDEQQKVLDAMVKGEAVESAWGYLENVSMLVLERNAIYRGTQPTHPPASFVGYSIAEHDISTEHDIDIKERADITVSPFPLLPNPSILPEIQILSSLAGNPSLLLTWQIQYILTIPGLIDRIRTQIGPYATVTKPFFIGTICEAPKLVLNHEGLSKKCPLLRSTYLETLRIVDENWDVKKAAMEGVSTVELDGMAFPGTFDPERFLATSSKEKEELTLSAEIINSSLYKSNVFMERTCLSLVAGILMFWDISPANKSAGWEIPEKQKIGGIAVPASETRVKIRRRRFEWVE